MRAKRIFLKKLAPTAQGNDAVDYKVLLMGHFSEAGAQGLTVGQVRERLKHIEVLGAAESYFDLEHRAHDTLVKELDTKRWIRVTENIVRFVDDIRDAPDAITADTVTEFKAPKEEFVEGLVR